MEKILTIGIPTYNRSEYLKKCLDSILSQIDGYSNLININVSDNASIDDTYEIVQNYIQQGYKINYKRNEVNIGLDGNFAALYEMADTKFIWMLADDDFIFPNTIKRVISIIEEHEFGILYLNNYWYDEKADLKQFDFNADTNITKYNDPIEFVSRINYWVTFTSGIIANKAIVKDKINIYEYDKTMFLLLGWIIPAIFQGKSNIVIENSLVGCKSNNTGGYKLYEVFGKNFNLIIDSLIRKGIDKRIKPIININLLKTFFPQFIKYRSQRFKNEDYLYALLPVFWRYPIFWKIYLIQPLRKKVKIPPFYEYMRNILLKLIKRLIRTAIAKDAIEFYKENEWKNISKNFRAIGASYSVVYPFIIKNPQYISIGKNFSSLHNLRIEAWDQFAGHSFLPEIKIGDNVCLNTDVHIACINKVIIGNGVLMASRIYISDHSHGEINVEALALPPLQRPLISKGPVIIEDNVWIGEGVCILPAVVIGKNSIIGANSVVTRSVPSNSVVAGVPAKIIKTLSA